MYNDYVIKTQIVSFERFNVIGWMKDNSEISRKLLWFQISFIFWQVDWLP